MILDYILSCVKIVVDFGDAYIQVISILTIVFLF